MIWAVMIEDLYIRILQFFVITTDYFTATMQHFRITFQLSQPDTGHNIRHIAFKRRRYNIIFPCAQLGFGQSILILTM